MKKTRVNLAAASLALVVVVSLAASALAAAGPSLAKGSSAAQPTAAATAAPTGGSGGAFLTINPLAGFPLDPFLVSAQGGGPLEAGALAQYCTGYIPANPTVTVDYEGKGDLLKVFFYSDGDTTLVIQMPDGKYVCSDDTSRLVLDPTVEIKKPALGRYNVWVGSAVAKDLVPGFLVFTARADTNASMLALGSLVKRPAAPEVIPVRDRLVNAVRRVEQAAAEVTAAAALKAGGKAVTKDFTATGEFPAVELQTGDTLCGGLVNVAPDYAFDWSGDAKALKLFAEASGDTTLLIRAPDGSFLCADDADGNRNLNPLLTIAKPAGGRYLVWVGRVDPSKPVTGKLTLTEAADAQPKALKKP
jgi:serine protease Do/protease YdgD